MTSWLFFSHSHGTLHNRLSIHQKHRGPYICKFLKLFSRLLTPSGVLLSTQLPQTPLTQISVSLPSETAIHSLRCPSLFCSPEGTSKQKPVQSCWSPCLFPASPGHSLELPVVQNLKVVVSYIFLVSSCLR